MARTEMPNATLLAISIDIQKMQQENLAVAFLLKEKIARFYQQNAMLLKIIDSRLAEFRKKYVCFGEDGKPLTEKDPETGVNKYIFICKDAELEFETEYKAFMTRYVTVES